MTRRKRDSSAIEWVLWPIVDPSVIEDSEQRLSATHRINALKMRLDGASPTQVTKVTGIHREGQARLLKRCIAPDDDGLPLGWRACLPGFQVRRKLAKESKLDVDLSRAVLIDKRYCGKYALQALFYRCPELKKMVHHAVIKGKFRKGDEPEPRSDREIHREFKKWCEDRNFKKYGYYPFNEGNTTHAREALRSYCARLRIERAREAAPANIDSTSADQLKFSSSGALHVFRKPLDRFELDGYELNCKINHTWIHPKDPSRLRTVTISGLLILAIVDSATSLICGYSIVYGTNHNVSDILRAIRSMYRPWQPRVFKHLEYTHKADGGLPSGRIENFRGICFDTLAMDSALANISPRTRRLVAKRIGCAFEYGRRGDKNRRPIIEGIFAQLAEKGFRKLPSGTRKDARVKPKRNAKALAAKYQVTDEMIEEVAEALVDTWNGSHASGNDGSRIEHMRRFLALPSTLARYMSEEELNKPWYDYVDEDAKVVASRNRGLHVNFHGRYRSKALQDYSLTNESISLYADTSNISWVHVYRKNGEFIGELIPEKRYQFPHSLRTRLEYLNSTSGHEELEDTADDFRRQIEEKEKVTTKEATFLARLKSEQRNAEARPAVESESPARKAVHVDTAEDDDIDDELMAGLGSFARRNVA